MTDTRSRPSECAITLGDLRHLVHLTGRDLTQCVDQFGEDHWYTRTAPRLTSHQVQACAVLFGDLFTDEIRALVEDREEARAVGMRDRVEALTGMSISLAEARALVIAARSDQ